MVSLDSASPASRAGAGLSLILQNISVEGGVRSKNDLQVDGMVKGEVSVRTLTVGESGHVDGVIAADFVEIRGRVTGSVSAKQVRLYAGAHVLGDICHEQLILESGVDFQGRSLRRAPADGPSAERTIEDGRPARLRLTADHDASAPKP
jgi:cytoskeletal protein CcmA (bactofilin family)